MFIQSQVCLEGNFFPQNSRGGAFLNSPWTLPRTSAFLSDQQLPSSRVRFLQEPATGCEKGKRLNKTTHIQTDKKRNGRERGNYLLVEARGNGIGDEEGMPQQILCCRSHTRIRVDHLLQEIVKLGVKSRREGERLSLLDMLWGIDASSQMDYGHSKRVDITLWS